MAKPKIITSEERVKLIYSILRKSEKSITASHKLIFESELKLKEECNTALDKNRLQLILNEEQLKKPMNKNGELLTKEQRDKIIIFINNIPEELNEQNLFNYVDGKAEFEILYGPLVVEEIKEKVKELSKEYYEKGLKYILEFCLKNPNITFSKGIKGKNLDDYLEKWVEKYKYGYENKASVKKSQKSNIVSDEIIKILYKERFNTNDSEVIEYEKAHRRFMAIENILGLILEEYIESKLTEKDWFMCWGETVQTIDFIKIDGSSLQIKNRDNSTNSSGNEVINNKKVERWYRVKSTTDEKMWNELNKIMNMSTEEAFSEEEFQTFAKNLINKNPYCIYNNEDI